MSQTSGQRGSYASFNWVLTSSGSKAQTLLSTQNLLLLLCTMNYSITWQL